MSFISGLARIAATVGIAEIPDSQLTSMSEDLFMTPVNPITPQIDISGEYRKALRFFGFNEEALVVKSDSSSTKYFLSQISGSGPSVMYRMDDDRYPRGGCACNPGLSTY
ncbi:MAG: hypothetical protein HYY43_04830 [Deltaproteobacteria bacterium]|nr:hypothetical protein [Deltaproteobacteria bacterium]MBI2974896.1 hypothetical protein [Deltaproteobacteria bacterium]